MTIQSIYGIRRIDPGLLAWVPRTRFPVVEDLLHTLAAKFSEGQSWSLCT